RPTHEPIAVPREAPLRAPIPVVKAVSRSTPNAVPIPVSVVPTVVIERPTQDEMPAPRLAPESAESPVLVAVSIARAIARPTSAAAPPAFMDAVAFAIHAWRDDAREAPLIPVVIA